MKNNKKQTNKRRADQKRNEVAALQAAWLTTITRICCGSILSLV